MGYLLGRRCPMPKKRPKAPKKPPTEAPEELMMVITINDDLEKINEPWSYVYTDADPIEILWFFLYIVRQAEHGGITFRAAVLPNQHKGDLAEHMRRAWRPGSTKRKKVIAKSLSP